MKPVRWLYPLLLILAGIAAYSNSFRVPFLFDDFYGIVNNPNLHYGVPLWKLLAGSIRPVVEVSLAINYRLGELNVWGYHAANLTIHLLAGWTLFELIRRTLRLHGSPAEAAWTDFLSFCAALIWMLHPLQTQAVVYLSQRAEILMGLFYLLTLYSLLRSVESPRHSGRWQAAALLSCLLGTWTKAGIITAPIAVLVYDRVFLASSYREIFRTRRWFYGALFGTWISAAALNISQETMAQTFAQEGRAVPFVPYFLTQLEVIPHYLKLAFWPKPLVFDYSDWPLVVHFSGKLLPAALGLAALAVATLIALARRPALGFLGAWFFLTLLPNTIFPLPDMAFEFRMFLPLAGLAVLFVFSLNSALQRRSKTVLAVLLPVIAAGLATGTFTRNRDYRSAVSLWSDTAAKRPHNGRAWSNLGAALVLENKPEEASFALRRAIALDSKNGQACFNLGQLSMGHGKWPEALALFDQAVQAKPNLAPAHQSRGIALESLGRYDEAFAAYTEAVRIAPELPEAHLRLGVLLGRRGEWKAAALEFGKAIQAKPNDARAYRHLGEAFTHTGLLEGAIFAYSQALWLDPEDEESRAMLKQLKEKNSR